MSDFENIKDDGILPAIVQDAISKSVLMLGYMNQNALNLTIKGPNVWFFSRSKKRLWMKGETSGNTLQTESVKIDCDNDTILVLAKPNGPVCHTKQSQGVANTTCFRDYHHKDVLNMGKIQPSVLYKLETTIQNRKHSDLQGDYSYTQKLFKSGTSYIAQKLIEEAGETGIAAATHSDNIKEEVADLIYHLLVLIADRDLKLEDIMPILEDRSTGSKFAL